MIFYMGHKKKQKNIYKKRAFRLKGDGGWKDLRPPYVLEAVYAEYIQQVISDCFV
jgi:hypothetical protein